MRYAQHWRALMRARRWVVVNCQDYACPAVEIDCGNGLRRADAIPRRRFFCTMLNTATAGDDRTVHSVDGLHRVDFSRDVVCMFGVPFDALRLTDAAERVVGAASNSVPCFISTPNINFLMLAQRDAAFRASVLASDMSLIDGTPLIWMARWLQLPLPERVAGSDLFDHLRAHSGRPLRVYFFGGPDGVARRAAAVLNKKPGGMRAVGHCEPGFGSVEELSGDSHIAHINASGANFLTVALGAQKGQAWIMRNQAKLQPAVRVHLGAVVNFVAGRVARAPMWVRRIGMEWVWRVLREPVLWRRYAMDGMALLALCVQRLWPLKSLHRRLAARPDPEGPSWTVRAVHAPTIHIDLKGAHRTGQLEPLRNALVAAARGGRDTVLSLHEAVDLDASAAGLLLLLEGYLAQRQAQLRLDGAHPDLALALRHNGLGHLLGLPTCLPGSPRGARHAATAAPDDGVGGAAHLSPVEAP